MKLSWDRDDKDVLTEDGEAGLPTVTRVEVIDHTGDRLYDGRAYVSDHRDKADLDVSISLQDDGRTLKVFVKRREGATAGSKAASAAAKVMKDPMASKDAKLVGASILTQVKPLRHKTKGKPK